MKVFTVINNRQSLGFNLLRLSCSLHNLELIVLVYEDDLFPSNRLKDKLLLDYLSRETDTEEVILFTDGFDTIMMAGEEEIMDKYRKVNKDVVFSCETACWPDPSLASRHPGDGGTRYRFLNSGGFAGRAGVIRELLENHPPETEGFEKSNQYIWMKRFFNNPGKIGLDTRCELFHTFSPEVGAEYMVPGALNASYYPYYLFMKQWFNSNFNIKNGRIYSKIANTWPCQAHFNGQSKILLDHDIIEMVFSLVPGLTQPKYIYESDRKPAGILS